MDPPQPPDNEPVPPPAAPAPDEPTAVVESAAVEAPPAVAAAVGVPAFAEAPPAAPPPAAPVPTLAQAEPPAAPPPAAAPVAAAAWAPGDQSSAPPAWKSDEATGPAPGVEFAGYGARLVAYILDGLLLGVAITAIWILLGVVLAGSINGDGEVGTAGAFASVVLVGASILLSLVYFPYFWQKSGRTPGMKVFNIKVVRDRDGGPIGWGSAILRYIGFFIDYIVLGIPIGLLWVFFDKRRRAWHDLIGSTVVIKG